MKNTCGTIDLDCAANNRCAEFDSDRLIPALNTIYTNSVEGVVSQSDSICVRADSEAISFMPSSTGSQADIKAGVDISRVHNSYFSDPKVVEAFLTKGVYPILGNLPKELRYVDFGGGQGFLTRFVQYYLATKGHIVKASVLDANQAYLDVAAQKGLDVILANIQNSGLSKEVDLATMRAVNHYNPLEKQLALLKSVFASLKKGGFLISQISSGSADNCALRSALVNLDSLGRAAENQRYHWTSPEEYSELLGEAGFSEIHIFGHAPDCSWTPEEQWDRFHVKETAEAMAQKDYLRLRKLEVQKHQFLLEAYLLIDKYIEVAKTKEKGGISQLGVEFEREKATINYQYPIIIARK